MVEQKLSVKGSIILHLADSLFYMLKLPNWELNCSHPINEIKSLFIFNSFPNRFTVYVVIIYWSPWVSCRILVPHPGIEPESLAVKVKCPNYWTTRKFSRFTIYCPRGSFSVPHFILFFYWYIFLLEYSWFAVLISAIQQSDSIIHKYTFLYSFPLCFISRYWI